MVMPLRTAMLMIAAVGLSGCASDQDEGPSTRPSAMFLVPSVALEPVAIAAFDDKTIDVTPPIVVDDSIDSI